VLNTLALDPNRFIRVSKSFTFDAAHQLKNYDGDCANLHGHTYKLEVICEGVCDERGIVVDFGDLKYIWETHCKKRVDHRNLTVEFPDWNTSAENLAVWFFQKFQAHLGLLLYAVRVYETPTCYAEVSRT